MLNLRSRREIGKMRQAGLLVWEAHQIVRSMVEPGTATATIDREVESFFESHKAEPLFKGYPGKKSPFPAVTCISVNEQVVHGIPSDRTLESGDIVSVDTGCRIGGWCGDSAWTYPVGDLADPAAKMLEVGEGALATAIERFGKSAKWSEAAQGIVDFCHGHGCSVVESLVGHGVGRNLHEEPQIPNYRPTGKTPVLQAGMCLAIEPMAAMIKKTVRIAYLR